MKVKNTPKAEAPTPRKASTPAASGSRLEKAKMKLKAIRGKRALVEDPAIKKEATVVEKIDGPAEKALQKALKLRNLPLVPQSVGGKKQKKKKKKTKDQETDVSKVQKQATVPLTKEAKILKKNLKRKMRRQKNAVAEKTAVKAPETSVVAEETSKRKRVRPKKKVAAKTAVEAPETSVVAEEETEEKAKKKKSSKKQRKDDPITAEKMKIFNHPVNKIVAAPGKELSEEKLYKNVSTVPAHASQILQLFSLHFAWFSVQCEFNCSHDLFKISQFLKLQLEVELVRLFL
jgi:hypothetical protein